MPSISSIPTARAFSKASKRSSRWPIEPAKKWRRSKRPVRRLDSVPEDVQLLRASHGYRWSGSRRIRGGRLLPSGHPLDDYMKPLAKLGVDSWASFHEKALKGATAGKLAGTVTHRQERRSKSGNKFAFVGFSDPTGQFEAICFSDTLAVSRDLLEPGKCGDCPRRGGCRGRGSEAQAFKASNCSIAPRRHDRGPHDFRARYQAHQLIGQRLANGGKAPVRLILQMEKGREVEIALGEKFTVTPQVKGAIKPSPGSSTCRICDRRIAFVIQRSCKPIG